MSPLDKLQFLVDVKTHEGMTFIQAVNYRSVQLDIGWATIISILDGKISIKPWMEKEINELFQIREEALAKAARFFEINPESELIH